MLYVICYIILEYNSYLIVIEYLLISNKLMFYNVYNNNHISIPLIYKT